MNIARMVVEANPDIGVGCKEISVLDIGGNDGKLTTYVSAGLADFAQKQVMPFVLEVRSNTTWDQNSKSAYPAVHEKCASVQKIIYDGSDMGTAKIVGTDSASPLDGKQFDCVMYQHSLHHFPSEGVQQNSLKQAGALLKEGGVLTITEHSSRLSGDDIDLMHVSIELFKALHEAPNATTDQLQQTYDQYMQEQTPANYLSQNRLVNMAIEAGFTPTSVTGASSGPDHVYSITFIKGDRKSAGDSSFAALTDPGVLKDHQLPKYQTENVASGMKRAHSLDSL
ncbi:hypothetical protein WL16_21565 [Burkholderia ubonensis]|nr:hypothetical protein WL16_21565 [Burkholderia ubonensis]KWC05242.1 hypothetical protein WL43_19030 [Burkholderia ubonensis]